MVRRAFLGFLAQQRQANPFIAEAIALPEIQTEPEVDSGMEHAVEENVGKGSGSSGTGNELPVSRDRVANVTARGSGSNLLWVRHSCRFSSTFCAIQLY